MIVVPEDVFRVQVTVHEVHVVKELEAIQNLRKI